MRKAAAILLIMCLVFQTFRQSALLTTYELNKELIVELFCVNKENVAMHCEGSCFMKEQLGKEDPQKGPAQEIAPEPEIRFFVQDGISFVFSFEPELQKGRTLAPEGVVQTWYETIFHPPQNS